MLNLPQHQGEKPWEHADDSSFGPTLTRWGLGPDELKVPSNPDRSVILSSPKQEASGSH